MLHSLYVGEIDRGIFSPSIFSSSCEMLSNHLRGCYLGLGPVNRTVLKVFGSNVLSYLIIIVGEIVSPRFSFRDFQLTYRSPFWTRRTKTFGDCSWPYFVVVNKNCYC